VSVAPLAVDVKGARMLSAEKMVSFQRVLSISIVSCGK